MKVVLPKDIVEVDGSKSTDDGGKLIYQWTKSDDSPGVGDIVNGSDRKAVLLLTNLVQGSYVFELTVTDKEGVEAKDSMTIHVESGIVWPKILTKCVCYRNNHSTYLKS